MEHVLDEGSWNPSGQHSLARKARLRLDEARESIARVLACEPGEVVFTSGGTESDNLAVLGVHGARPGTVVCSAVEHPAVLRCCERTGARVVPVDSAGVLDLEALAGALDPAVSLVSVMLANNEVGVIQPVGEVADMVRALAPDAALHTDAVHAAPWLDVGACCARADLVSLSAHKFGGPVGSGVLVVRSGTPFTSTLYGGSQELGRRAGTENVVGAVGMAAALAASADAREAEVERVGQLRDRLVHELVEGSVEARESALYLDGTRPPKVAGSCHVCVEGVDSQELLFALDRAGVCASAGSACSSGAREPSHVLAAMGVSPRLALGALRLTLGHTTTAAEVDHAVEAVGEAVAKLRTGRQAR